MKNTLLTSFTLLSTMVVARAQYSAYLPAAGELNLTPTYTYSYYDKAWIGKTKMEIDQDQHGTFLSGQYGITDRFAFDATVGYAWAEIEGMGNDDGLTDTTLGFTFAALQEDAGAPLQVAFRVGAIIPGTYDAGTPFAIGDGAAGVETSILLAKEIATGFGLYGDFGYRWRDNDVPEDLFASGGVYGTFGPVTLAAGYRGSWGIDGGDIGGPGFGQSYGFPQVKEIQHNLEVSLGFSDPGDRFYQLFYSRTLDGRNTGEDNVFGAAITIPFGGSAGPAPQPVESPGKNPVRSSK
jgi:hypothetical protein